MDTTKNIFLKRTGKQLSRLLRDVVQSPSLGDFKIQLEQALSNLVFSVLVLFYAGGWTTDVLSSFPRSAPFQPELFYDLKNL